MNLLVWAPKDRQTSLSMKRDAVLFAMLYLFNWFTFSAYPQLIHVAVKPWLPLAWLYGLTALVPLLWRNKAPMTVFIAQSILTVIAWPFMSLYTPVVGIPIALYAVASRCNKRLSLPALLISLIPNGLAATAAGLAAKQISTFVSSVVFLVLASIGAFIAGRLTQASHRHIEYLEREQAASREAEERVQAAVREAEVIAAERRRIARELHDSISHAVTVIVLLASGAAQIIDTSAEQAKQSLVSIATTAKEAMDELRRLLTVLGSGSTNDAVSRNGLGLQPGLAGLPALLDSVRATGMSITVHSEGEECALPASVEEAAYRIVQEGLTNVLKHASKDAKPQLRLVWETESLLIQIDNGTGLAEVVQLQTTTGGWGLRGLRERVDSTGGYLNAQPHAGVGFRLTAILPLRRPGILHRHSFASVSPTCSLDDGGNQWKI